MADGSRLKIATSAAILVAVAALGFGCSSDQLHEYHANSDRVTSGAGNAMAANRAIHTIDPWPRSSQNTEIDNNGKRAQVAIRRYESNTSTKPKGLTYDSTAPNGSSNGGQKN